MTSIICFDLLFHDVTKGKKHVWRAQLTLFSILNSCRFDFPVLSIPLLVKLTC